MQRLQVAIVEVAFEEHQVGDGNVAGGVERGAELLGGGSDRRAPRVRVDRADRQPVARRH